MDGETDSDQLDAIRRHTPPLLGASGLAPRRQITAGTRIDRTAGLLARALAPETADDIEAEVADVYRHAG